VRVFNVREISVQVTSEVSAGSAFPRPHLNSQYSL
jgi:hypothetical protein